MFSRDDTIVAIATPPGHGGIGVVRISGPSAARIAHALMSADAPLRPRHATLCSVNGVASEIIDRAIAVFFPAPHSYTGEDVVEVSAHGSPVVLQAIVSAASHAGARLAEPGEFTLRAFLNGRIDLVQAEAIGDLVSAVTPVQARAAFDQLDGTLTRQIGAAHARLFDIAAQLEASLDFPDEGYHFLNGAGVAAELRGVRSELRALADAGASGRLIREGRSVAIVGRPNAGKSSLFNALVGSDRAIVTPVPGTTRDVVTEVVDIEGCPVTLMDTAGLHETTDVVELEGVRRTRQALDTTDLLVLVLDSSAALTAEDHALLEETAARPSIVARSKSDLVAAWDGDVLAYAKNACAVSALSGAGLDALRRAMIGALGATTFSRDTPAVTNIRHVRLLRTASDALDRAIEAAIVEASEEFVLTDVHAARVALEEITGHKTADDVLAHIFATFCIGK